MSVRHVRAQFDDRAVVVYQAYCPEISGPAVNAGTFVAPFRRGRMTWIKPSFLWMMYRSDWATKSGQERVLAVKVTRIGFDWALDRSVLSHYDPQVYADEGRWAELRRASPVRVQWDPERSLRLERLERRAIQIGLGGEAVDRYVDEWILDITDVTNVAHKIHGLVDQGRLDRAADLLPTEKVYPITEELRVKLGAS